MTQPPPPMPPGRDPLPGRTTPTWEMELLISGATVFSLLQMPGLLDRLYYAAAPRLEADYAAMLTLPYLYLMTACLALIVTFLAHLCVRGYWVALVGLHSVYPEGVKWQSLHWGPAFVDVLRRRTPPLPDAIEHYDNRASQVFGFGIGLTFLSIGIGLSVVLLILVTVAANELTGRAMNIALLLNSLVMLTIGPYLALYIIDSLIRKHPERYPRLTRWIKAAFQRLLRLPFLSGSNYPLLLFSSHVGGQRGNILGTLALLLLIAASAARMELSPHLWRLDGYGLLSASDQHGHTLDPRHYADQRERLGTLLPAVHIPSEHIEGDWLRVYIPFRPTPDSHALKRLCPVLDEPGKPAQEAVLACLPQRFVLAIDGTPPAAPDFVFASDPEQGLRGVVAMLDLRDLPRGRHEVSLRYGDARQTDAIGDDPERPAIRIPFWR